MILANLRWKSSIKIGDLHAQYQSGGLPIMEVAKRLADRLEKYRAKKFQPDSEEWHELGDVIDWFREDVNDVDDYDGVLHELYEWADQGKRLWIDKFSE